MNRKEMIAELSERLELDKKLCVTLLDVMQDTIISALAKGGTFKQYNFGTFTTVMAAERVGVNPATGQRMRFPKKRKIKFSPAKSLKEMLNGE